MGGEDGCGPTGLRCRVLAVCRLLCADPVVFSLRSGKLFRLNLESFLVRAPTTAPAWPLSRGFRGLRLHLPPLWSEASSICRPYRPKLNVPGSIHRPCRASLQVPASIYRPCRAKAVIPGAQNGAGAGGWGLGPLWSPPYSNLGRVPSGRCPGGTLTEGAILHGAYSGLGSTRWAGASRISEEFVALECDHVLTLECDHSATRSKTRVVTLGCDHFVTL